MEKKTAIFTIALIMIFSIFLGGCYYQQPSGIPLNEMQEHSTSEQNNGNPAGQGNEPAENIPADTQTEGNVPVQTPAQGESNDEDTDADIANEINSAESESYCRVLSERFDSRLVDTNNPAGRYIINAQTEGISIVGAILAQATQNSDYDEYNSYTLKFISLDGNIGELYLITTSKQALPYETGNFYEFDARNIDIYSMHNSGLFIDNELNKLKPVNCD